MSLRQKLLIVPTQKHKPERSNKSQDQDQELGKRAGLGGPVRTGLLVGASAWVIRAPPIRLYNRLCAMVWLSVSGVLVSSRHALPSLYLCHHRPSLLLLLSWLSPCAMAVGGGFRQTACMCLVSPYAVKGEGTDCPIG
jgi:hypothetical protein